MELEDSNFLLVEEIIATTLPDVAFQDADVAIILGGYPRKPGMERRDLISMNASIIRSQVNIV